MKEYRTIRGRGAGEYEEKKSRFLGEAVPVTTEEEVREELAGIRKKYYDARHHCYAYILGENGAQKRFSDDGEPQGTAGNPILAVLEGQGIRDALVVVTRYFGGTLLGTGGLVRSYTEAAKRAVAAAGIALMQEGEVLQIVMDYSLLDRVNYWLGKEKIRILDTAYTDRVTEKLLVRADRKEDVLAFLLAAGSGKITAGTLRTGYFPFDTDEGAR